MTVDGQINGSRASSPREQERAGANPSAEAGGRQGAHLRRNDDDEVGELERKESLATANKLHAKRLLLAPCTAPRREQGSGGSVTTCGGAPGHNSASNGVWWVE